MNWLRKRRARQLRNTLAQAEKQLLRYCAGEPALVPVPHRPMVERVNTRMGMCHAEGSQDASVSTTPGSCTS
jgi:hypothetical protein